MYLWEFELNDEKCGWFSVYQDAKTKYPQGKVLGLKLINDNILSCRLDPVKTHMLMQSTFNKLKSEAIYLNNNREVFTMENLLTKMIDIDVCLYNLLHDWYLPTNTPETELEFFGTFEYFSNQKYRNYNLYFVDSAILYPELHEARIFPMCVGTEKIDGKLSSYHFFF